MAALPVLPTANTNQNKHQAASQKHSNDASAGRARQNKAQEPTKKTTEKGKK